MMAVAAITLCCTLFVSMGLSDAIQEVIDTHIAPLSCPRCLSFWAVLVYSLATSRGIVASVAAAFICAYIAMWMTLLFDYITTIYNRLYDKINQTDTQTRQDNTPADQVSKMQVK